ncbi:ORF371 [White spot syndrome virus]|uniref:ORF371 n=1 Tax=White spot syndrome virus TaxID=342409 RepID=A0A2D3I6T5_9VIRU|nr:ORF371 [White spot syndrome virus]
MSPCLTVFFNNSFMCLVMGCINNSDRLETPRLSTILSRMSINLSSLIVAPLDMLLLLAFGIQHQQV